jgi:hypothetical protein
MMACLYHIENVFECKNEAFRTVLQLVAETFPPDCFQSRIGVSLSRPEDSVSFEDFTV